MRLIRFAIGVTVLAMANLLTAFPEKPVSYDSGRLSILELVDNTPDVLYHIGGDACTQGDANYGPVCAREIVGTEHYKATLTLTDGRTLDVSTTHVGGLAKLEALTQGHKGTWDIQYRIIGRRHVYYPFQPVHDHDLERIEVVFPMMLNGKVHPVAKVIDLDLNDAYARGVDVEE